MMTRRVFISTTFAAAAASRARALSGAAPQSAGANDRIRVGVIGCGNRANQVTTEWLKHKDSTFVAACDVARNRLEEMASKLGQAQSSKLEVYEDYRRLLERKDIDVVLVATPDHWHSPITVDACAAGKDVYCEKPVSNAIDPALKMIDAARRHNRVVQVGLQQRSWPHFQEAAKLFQDGYIGKIINHCVMSPPGGGGPVQQMEAAQAPPPDLNWEMFQGPAKRTPYVPSRQRSWRSYYDYGGGSITDWGVHLVDVMNWYMQADTKTPLLASASAQYVRLPHDPERVPDAFSVTWQYDNYVATLSNAVVPGPENAQELYGNYFFGDRGVLLVNRLGYEIKPIPRAAGRGGAGRGQAPNAPPLPEPPPPIVAKKFRDPSGMSEIADSQFGSATGRHVRNFLDCVKSRQRPAADIEIGFNSSLPCLLAVMAVRQGRTLTWDGKTAKTT
jgi:predicted dehydrogenase